MSYFMSYIFTKIKYAESCFENSVKNKLIIESNMDFIVMLL